MSLAHIVIAGAGQAGYQVAASLRQDGYTGTLTLVGDEPGVPYQRPSSSRTARSVRSIDVMRASTRSMPCCT
jgi:NADPH-dependent 2,4-dienoyl-CoA reductase/sulfur reductase-like enzyme